MNHHLQVIFTSNIRLRNNLSESGYFHCGWILGSRQAGLSISITADLMGFLHMTVSTQDDGIKLQMSYKLYLQTFVIKVQKHLDDERGQWKMPRWSEISERLQ